MRNEFAEYLIPAEGATGISIGNGGLLRVGETGLSCFDGCSSAWYPVEVVATGAVTATCVGPERTIIFQVPA